MLYFYLSYLLISVIFFVLLIKRAIRDQGNLYEACCLTLGLSLTWPIVIVWNIYDWLREHSLRNIIMRSEYGEEKDKE